MYEYNCDTEEGEVWDAKRMIRRPSLIGISLNIYPKVCPSVGYNWISSSKWPTLG